MAGFWRGFAEGWHKEIDRQEKRKLWEEEVALKREGMFAEMMGKRLSTTRRTAAAGSSGRSDGDGGPSSWNHEAQLLTNYGLPAEAIAQLDQRGGLTALQYAREQLESWPEHIRTDENIADFLGGIVTTTVPGQTLDWEEMDSLAERMGLKAGVPEYMKPMLEQSAEEQATVLVDSTYEPPEALSTEQLKYIRDDLSEAPARIAARKVRQLTEASQTDPEALKQRKLWEEIGTLAGEGEYGMMRDLIVDYNTDDNPENDIDLMELRDHYDYTMRNVPEGQKFADPFWEWVVATTDAQMEAAAAEADAAAPEEGATFDPEDVPEGTEEALTPAPPGSSATFDPDSVPPGTVRLDKKTGRTVVKGTDGVWRYTDGEED